MKIFNAHVLHTITIIKIKESTQVAISGSAWKILPALPCKFSSLFVFDGSILVFGGPESTACNESTVYVYDVSNESQPWQHIQNNIPAEFVVKAVSRELLHVVCGKVVMNGIVRGKYGECLTNISPC